MGQCSGVFKLMEPSTLEGNMETVLAELSTYASKGVLGFCHRCAGVKDQEDYYPKKSGARRGVRPPAAGSCGSKRLKTTAS